MSCNSVLLSQKGEVKIGNVENCRYQGDFRLFAKSFSKIMVSLMYKSSNGEEFTVLGQQERWSLEAVDFFTLCSTLPMMLEAVLGHRFLSQRDERPLALLVFLTLMEVNHDKQYFD